MFEKYKDDINLKKEEVNNNNECIEYLTNNIYYFNLHDIFFNVFSFLLFAMIPFIVASLINIFILFL